MALYEDKRRKRARDRKSFRRLNGRSMSYLDHLKENMPMVYPNSWVVLTGKNDPPSTRESVHSKVPIRSSFVWSGTYDQYVGLFAAYVCVCLVFYILNLKS